jgi:hypothetical protein
MARHKEITPNLQTQHLLPSRKNSPSRFRNPAREIISICSNQDGLVRLEIFLDGLDAVAGIGHADGVGLAEFVMHEEFADHPDLKIGLGHAPELAGFQGLLAGAAGRFNFYHGSSCALPLD